MRLEDFPLTRFTMAVYRDMNAAPIASVTAEPVRLMADAWKQVRRDFPQYADCTLVMTDWTYPADQIQREA